MANLRSQLDRAVAAYLRGAGVANHVYIGNTSEERKVADGGNVTVISRAGRPAPANTGVYAFSVNIEVRYQAALSVDEPNPDANRIALDAVVDAIYAALMLSDNQQNLDYTARQLTAAGNALATATDGSDEAILRAANNADMSEFTVLNWYESQLDGGMVDDSGAIWMEKLTFEGHAASKAGLG